MAFFLHCLIVPLSFNLVKQGSAAFPSLAIGKAVTEVMNLNNTLVLYYVSLSMVFMCGNPHFASRAFCLSSQW